MPETNIRDSQTGSHDPAAVAETFEQQHYRNTMLVPRLWIEKADALTKAASRLEHEIGEGWSDEAAPFRGEVYALLPVYLMLTAYAVENMLKALVVRSKHDDLAAALTQKQRLPKELTSHDLF